MHLVIFTCQERCNCVYFRYWKLCDWIANQRFNLARSVGLETAKKQVARDFARWAQNINLIGYDSAKTLSQSAEFAHFQWALTAPSYVQPFYNYESKKPGFLIADIVYGRIATEEDVKFFLDKLAVVRSFKKVPAFLPVLVADSLTKDALMLLKENKVLVALIKNIFDESYSRLLSELVSVFTNASAIISKNPSQIEKLFSDLSKAEGRYNDMIGDMFELITAYYFQQVGCRYLDIRKHVQIPNSTANNEIDVLVEQSGRIIIVECKATRSPIGMAFVEKWLSKNVPQIRSWVVEKYPDKDISFQLWSLGGFSPEALKALSDASANTKKYEIDYLDRDQIVTMARQQHVQPVVELLQSQHFQPSLKQIPAKAI